MTREDVVRMARECGISVSEGNTFADDCYISVLYWFANKVIEHFLTTTGQYVTNDASREAAIQAAVAVEREECAKVCENFNADHQDCNYYDKAMAAAIRTRGEK